MKFDICLVFFCFFLNDCFNFVSYMNFQLRTRNSTRGFVRPLVRPYVVIELESVKTLISAPAHPSATGIGRVSGLVLLSLLLNSFSFFYCFFFLISSFSSSLLFPHLPHSSSSSFLFFLFPLLPHFLLILTILLLPHYSSPSLLFFFFLTILLLPFLSSTISLRRGL